MGDIQKVLVSGLYYSGSSAVVDFLGEFSNVAVIPGEFDDFRRYGMLGDRISDKRKDIHNNKELDSYINNFGFDFDKNISLRRVTKNLVKKLLTKPPLTYLIRNSDFFLLSKRLDLLNLYNRRINEIGNQDERISCAIEWLSDVIKIYGRKEETDYVVFDQPIFFNSHSEIWPRVFHDSKVVIVYRNPIDQIGELVERGLIYEDIESASRSLIEIYGDSKASCINFAIDSLYHRLKSVIRIKEELGDQRILLVKFDDLVFDYNLTSDRIQKFLNLEEKFHELKLSRFNPVWSKPNVGKGANILDSRDINLINSRILHNDEFSQLFKI